MEPLPASAVVVVETSRWSFVKRGGGGIDFVSPVPTPFNYGSLPGTVGADGEPLDAVVLGPRLPRGHRAEWPVLGVVRFVDRGKRDDKLVCGPGTLHAGRRRALRAFFTVYALVKRLRGSSRFEGIEVRAPGA